MTDLGCSSSSERGRRASLPAFSVSNYKIVLAQESHCNPDSEYLQFWLGRLQGRCRVCIIGFNACIIDICGIRAVGRRGNGRRVRDIAWAGRDWRSLVWRMKVLRAVGVPGSSGTIHRVGAMLAYL